MGDYARSVLIALPPLAGMVAVSHFVDGWTADVLLVALLAIYLLALWLDRRRSTTT